MPFEETKQVPSAEPKPEMLEKASEIARNCKHPTYDMAVPCLTCIALALEEAVSEEADVWVNSLRGEYDRAEGLKAALRASEAAVESLTKEREGESMKAKEWRQQFEVLIEEAEAYMVAHAKTQTHDVDKCNGIGLRGNEWSCLRMSQALALCRQVLEKHP